MKLNLKKTEAETLRTFKKHRPSEYFSHLSTLKSFQDHEAKVERLYRYGLTFPPEMFKGKTLIDLGAGTGEHTVSLARWGASCTLVEMNDEALNRAKENFKKHAKEKSKHQFVHSSLYDICLHDLKEQFDISHSRGVFTHVADKKKAFKILASLAKRGGYVIFGDRNTCGGVQEMLQRLAIYKLGGNSDDKIVEISEALFSDDIDRSQRSVPRTREAIIFDRWVIQQQDDPSVEEILAMFESEGLEYVSSWPRIDFLGRGTSTHSDPKNNHGFLRAARLVENLWMILNQGEYENIETFEPIDNKYFDILKMTAGKLRNLQINSNVNPKKLGKDFNLLKKLSNSFNKSRAPLHHRLETFFSEVISFLQLIEEQKNPEKIRKKLKSFKILFKGYAGVRHVDFVAYKPIK